MIAYIEGRDEQLKDELIFITAHYDHLGKKGDKIYNGADDNASGTAAVIEIAEAFVEAKKHDLGPRRSIVCMLVSGEEKGLLGSKYYTEYPLFPLENTIANLNIDMVGRVDEKHADNPNYIYLIGLHSIDISWDGTRLAMATSRDYSHNYSLWTKDIKDTTGRSYARLTGEEDGRVRYPSWSPDGRHIAYAADKDGARNIWVADLP